VSLKAFHIFFIVVSILFVFGFGMWEFIAYASDKSGTELLLGCLSSIAGVGLIVYLMQVIKKFKMLRTI